MLNDFINPTYFLAPFARIATLPMKPLNIFFGIVHIGLLCVNNTPS